MKTIYINLIRTSNFTAKAIHLGEGLLENKIKENHTISHNHCEVGYVDPITNVRMTSGSRSDGTTTVKGSDYLEDNDYKIVDIIEYKIDVSENEGLLAKSYLDFAENIKYEYFMFLWYTVKLICGRGFGSNSSKRLYCVEHCIRAINTTNKFDLIKTSIGPRTLKKILNEKCKRSN